MTPQGRPRGPKRAPRSSRRHPKTPKIEPKSSPGAKKSIFAKVLKTLRLSIRIGFRTLKFDPKSTQNRLQEASGTHLDDFCPPKLSQEAFLSAPGRSGRPPGRPKGPKEAPKGPPRPPSGSPIPWILWAATPFQREVLAHFAPKRDVLQIPTFGVPLNLGGP